MAICEFGYITNSGIEHVLKSIPEDFMAVYQSFTVFKKFLGLPVCKYFF
jgi:hypothetical protein